MKHWFDISIVFFKYLIVVLPEGFCLCRRLALMKTCSLSVLLLCETIRFGNKVEKLLARKLKIAGKFPITVERIHIEPPTRNCM